MHTPRWRLLFVALGAWGTALVLAPGATALTLGSLAPANAPAGETCTGCHGFQTETAASSPSYAVPAGKWKIVSWRSRNTTGSKVRARLWVFRPTSTADRYKLVAKSHKKPIPAHSAPRFATHIRVKSGDLLGVDTFGDMVFAYETAASRDVTSAPECNPALGQAVGTGTPCSLFSEGHGRVNVSVVAHRRRH